MSASVEPTSIARRFRAWCPVHSDGWNGTKATAEKWAARHNAEHHPEPPEPEQGAQPRTQKIDPAAPPQ